MRIMNITPYRTDQLNCCHFTTASFCYPENCHKNVCSWSLIADPETNNEITVRISICPLACKFCLFKPKPDNTLILEFQRKKNKGFRIAGLTFSSMKSSWRPISIWFRILATMSSKKTVWGVAMMDLEPLRFILRMYLWWETSCKSCIAYVLK